MGKPTGLSFSFQNLNNLGGYGINLIHQFFVLTKVGPEDGFLDKLGMPVEVGFLKNAVEIEQFM